MDRIKVELLNVTPDFVGLKALSKPYHKKEVSNELFVKVAKILKHESIMEHIVFSFDIDGISRLCLQELARHRLASLTVCSTRFTLKEVFKSDDLKKYFVVPITFDSLSTLYYLDAIGKQLEIMREFELYTTDEVKYLLPESFRTSLVWTINARSLSNFFSLRLSKKAHFEIKYLAQKILHLVSFHMLFEDN